MTLKDLTLSPSRGAGVVIEGHLPQRARAQRQARALQALAQRQARARPARALNPEIENVHPHLTEQMKD